MNEGAHHWASSLDFLVGQRKRGNRRELLPLGTRSVESSDVAVRVSKYHGGFARIFHRRDQILLRLTRLHLFAAL